LITRKTCNVNKLGVIFDAGQGTESAAHSATWVHMKSEHTQLDCDHDPTLPALRASSASFVKIFLPAMRPDSQAPVI
jgi:hypothetical protein